MTPPAMMPPSAAPLIPEASSLLPTSWFSDVELRATLEMLGGGEGNGEGRGGGGGATTMGAMTSVSVATLGLAEVIGTPPSAVEMAVVDEVTREAAALCTLVTV